MLIRKMTEADRERYFEMSRDFYACGAALKAISEERRRSFWSEIAEGKLVQGYIFEQDGETAGYALAFCYASQELGGRVAFIDELYVRPEFRGRGIAREFFAFIEEGAVACRLEVESGNKRAAELYSSIGYKFGAYRQMIKIKN